MQVKLVKRARLEALRIARIMCTRQNTKTKEIGAIGKGGQLTVLAHGWIFSEKGSKTDFTLEIGEQLDSILKSSASEWVTFFPVWTVITSDKEILSDIKGMKIELLDILFQHHFTQTKFTNAETEIITSELYQMENKGIIELKR